MKKGSSERGKEGKRERGKEGKRERGKEGKRERGKEGKRERGKGRKGDKYLNNQRDREKWNIAYLLTLDSCVTPLSIMLLSLPTLRLLRVSIRHLTIVAVRIRTPSA